MLKTCMQRGSLSRLIHLSGWIRDINKVFKWLHSLRKAINCASLGILLAKSTNLSDKSAVLLCVIVMIIFCLPLGKKEKV